MKQNFDKYSFGLALGLHIGLGLLLFLSVEHTIHIPPDNVFDPNKKIIQAVMVNNQTLQNEAKRLAALEAKKQALAQEKEREKEQEKQKEKEKEKEIQAIQEKEAQAVLAKQEEEAAALLAKNALEKEKKEKLEKLEKEKLAEKLEKQKLEKEKIAQQKQLDKKLAEEKIKAQALVEKKQQEEAAALQANMRVKQDMITRYAMLMRNKIHQNWRQPLGVDFGGFKCKVAVRLLPTGEVLEAVVVESSGSVEFDRSTELAIRKASPLPMPEDASVARDFHQFTFTFHPEAA